MAGLDLWQGCPLATTVLVEAHIDPALKIEAEKILAEEGLTLADALRMLLVATVRDRGLPVRYVRPNAETIEAMEAARRGELTHAGTVEQLMSDLHADD